MIPHQFGLIGFSAPYGGKLCTFTSTLPAYQFGTSDILGKCFQDYYLCQDAIMSGVGVILSIVAAIFHVIGFISSCWDCHTQIDSNDWGDHNNRHFYKILIFLKLS